MNSFDISCEWAAAAAGGTIEVRETSAYLSLHAGGMALTRNEDSWSKTVKDSVLLSAYPLALWFASSWWRLMHEPAPLNLRANPVASEDWRMAHEMGAANHGFVWPNITLAADGEMMQVSSLASQANLEQSVRYLAGIQSSVFVPLQGFQQNVDAFIERVIARLTDLGQKGTDLESLWALVLGDRADPEATRLRRYEASLGFDPEMCPPEVLKQSESIATKLGERAFAEVAPVYGSQLGADGLDRLSELLEQHGVEGEPDVSGDLFGDLRDAKIQPWLKGVQAAQKLRAQVAKNDAKISNQKLYGLLGLEGAAITSWRPSERQQASIAVPMGKGRIKFIPRKAHPVSRRFELSRLLGDYLLCGVSNKNQVTLASTDLYTARQKSQRAFAAEFLCPISALTEFLENDYSEIAKEEAALKFGVSEKTVEYQLSNNRVIPTEASRFDRPYQPV
jgi:Zn-dependent peptidase ImmA (M78 family)